MTETIIRDANTVIEVLPKASSLGTMVIGGDDATKFIPNLNCSYDCSSNDEKYFINFNRRGAAATVSPDIDVDGKVIADTTANEQDIFYKTDDGHYKWDVVYQSKPLSNIVQWDIKKSPEITFYYQPALTAQQITDGYIRPEEVEGSYAVFCDKTQNYLDSEGNQIVNYKQGKIDHIYRILLKDSATNEVWVDLDITDDVLIAEMPQTFLDSATYPVTLDPTFGFDPGSTPGTQVTVGNAVALIGSSFIHTASSGDIITMLTAYCRRQGGTGDGSMAIYEISGTTIGDRLAAIEAITGVTGSAAFRDTATVSQPLVASTVYCIATQEDTNDFRLFLDTGATDDRRLSSTTTLDDPFSNGGLGVDIYAFFATFTAGGVVDVVDPLPQQSYRRVGRTHLDV